MPVTIPVAHDYICPWCWVGFFQAQKLRQEFGVEIEWIGYELLPKEMEYDTGPPKVEPTNKPATLSRFGLLMAAEGMQLPLVPKPPKVRSFNAHQATEYAKTEGVQDAFVEAVYRAFWEEGRDINSVDVLSEIAQHIVGDIVAMRTAIESDQFGDKVIDFDDDAHAQGVYNVPTFFVGEKRLAEQPYPVLRKAMVEFVGREPTPTLYDDISFSNPHICRPFTFINMVSTVDGKILTGDRNESVQDLGSETDHFLMKRLEGKADAILVGANSLRASGVNWNPVTKFRIVVSRSGNVPWGSQFLTQGTPIPLTIEELKIAVPPGVTVLRAGKSELDWKLALRKLLDLGIQVVNVLGGSIINGQLLEQSLIDELFLTIAPKIKLGEEVPTIAGGTPFPREKVQTFSLVSHQAIGDELFLRYRK